MNKKAASAAFLFGAGLTSELIKPQGFKQTQGFK